MASRPTRARCAICDAVARGRAAPGRGHAPAPTAPACSPRPASTGQFDACVDGVGGRPAAPGAASPPRTPTWPRPGARRAARPAAVVYEDALAGVASGRAGHFGYVVGVDRVGQADALRASGADVVVERPGRPAGGAMIQHPSFPVDRGPCARPNCTSTCWPRPSRCSRWPTATSAGAATWTRGSRTGCPALPERALRAAPAALRGGGLRLPGVRPDADQRHQRQADPAAGRRRAFRRALRRAAARTSGCWTSGPAR